MHAVSSRESAIATAPGSVGNVGPGLDILGLAVAGRSDQVTLAWADRPGITIIAPGHPDLPTDPTRHSAAIAANEVFRIAGMTPKVTLAMVKELPLAAGQGGSAASAVAGAVAANHLVGARLDATSLLNCALIAETTVAGRHADNLAPSLLGGLVLVTSIDPLEWIELPVPDALRVVLVHPEQRLLTRDARAVLPAHVSRGDALAQAAHVAAMVAAAYRGDAPAFGRAIVDRIAEPARAPMLPGFVEAQAAARNAGGLGGSISGAGPTAFAIVDDEGVGARVATAMIAAYAACGVIATARIASVDRRGAQVGP
ncbi:MAG TPA: homoserine kinase [Gemmatimonadales bacterium]|jgi:homoserine kinase